jgi:hypothetical protein
MLGTQSEFSIRKAPFGDNIFPFHVSNLAQPLAESLGIPAQAGATG